MNIAEKRANYIDELGVKVLEQAARIDELTAEVEKYKAFVESIAAIDHRGLPVNKWVDIARNALKDGV
jgi:hypothetical protein